MVRLWLDSTVARNSSQVRELAELASPRDVRLLVSAHIHLEQYRHERVQRGDRFNLSIFNQFLERLSIDVVELRMTQDTAERWGERLADRYPTADEWAAAKARSIKAKLPSDGDVKRGHLPMTADWLVALQVEDDEQYIVTDDTGPEWEALRSSGRAMTFEEAKHRLGELSMP